MSAEAEKKRPAPIRKLEESVINRIAAGEIINRPSNALKELIENSLDAGATSISINIKDGGLKMLQIQDNGHGIRTEDLPLVCERFTTSKLRVYEDLSTIQTYGFRGEALASISHVSHLSIVTKQANSDCAYKAHYVDGKLAPPKPGASSDPEPCAGNNGTLITAEDLFYNIPSRRSALKNTREEYSRIFDVASRYAIHNSGIAFTCRKLGTAKADLSTLAGATAIANIRQVFGNKIASSVVPVEYRDDQLAFSLKGYVSSATHEMHKSVFLLFINHRLVDHTPIKRATEALYSSIFPKAARPFIYLDLRIKPEDVDVNVHPTKREVRFLNEDSIINAIVETIQKRLLDGNDSRPFAVQSTLTKGSSFQLNQRTPGLPALSSTSSIGIDGGGDTTPLCDSPDTSKSASAASTAAAPATPVLNKSASSLVSGGARKTPVNKTVRTNYKTLSLESFSFGVSPSIKRSRVQTTIDPDFSVSPTRTTPKRAPLRVSPSHANRNTSPDRAAEAGRAGDQDDSDFVAALPLHGSTLLNPEPESIAPLFGNKSKPPEAAPASEPALGHGSLDRQISAEYPALSSTANPERSYLSPNKDPRVEVQYSSILNLRKHLQRHSHPELTRVLSEHTFVGFIDDRRALVQHQTRLYMIDYCKISYHIFYHRCLFDFMNYGRLVLQPAPAIYDLGMIAATELGVEDPEKCAKEILDKFSSRGVMLEEFFHMKISDIGTIETMPMVIRDYSPDFDKLPLFLYNTTYFANWEEEQPFLKSFINEMATLYALEPPLSDDPQNAKDEYRLMAEHRVLPALKGNSFWAPNSLLQENAIVELVDQTDLYRIFERC
ncbi:DNA mismatch repair protein [Dipsacomyces acuminosporus]|nr:DNA mismatch repair protein [Dipsacomyces acuminosporus]